MLEAATNERNVNADELFAVFISNDNRSVPVWYQKRCSNEETPAVWDYHVIAVHKSKSCSASFVYDLDTQLNFPESFETYAEKAFQLANQLSKKYAR